jgi:BirA family transcriptional regulator, biotin operon repressor / biotin---[acetyl-CoA-carboxylase] ligase
VSKNLLGERSLALQRMLQSMSPDLEVFSYDKLESTMDESYCLLQQGAGASGMLVDCRVQTAGRGRQGRAWASSFGNLAFTLVLPVTKVQPQTPLVVSCAIHKALQDFTGKKFIIKWPNDILSEDRKKICGVLIERRRSGSEQFDLIGVGLNVQTAPLPEVSCSLSDMGVSITDVIELETAIVSCMLRFLQQFEFEGFESLNKYWLENTFSLGTIISFKFDNKLVTGEFRGLSSQGELLLQTGQGELVSFFSGDIVLMQP